MYTRQALKRLNFDPGWAVGIYVNQVETVIYFGITISTFTIICYYALFLIEVPLKY